MNFCAGLLNEARQFRMLVCRLVRIERRSVVPHLRISLPHHLIRLAHQDALQRRIHRIGPVVRHARLHQLLYD